MKRYLAFDIGDKRTGVAVGDDLLKQAGPVDMFETRDEADLLAHVTHAINTYGPDEIVVGLPLNMDGTEGPAAKRIHRLADAIQEKTGLVVHRFDERLTSFEADDQMRQSGLTRGQKKARRDALAAAAILRDFLETKPGN